MESVGVLAGGIAHDFNNILAAILGNVNLIQALTSENDKRYHLLEDLEKASIRARGLTQQLLTFSKGGEPVREVASISEIIRESAEFVLRGSNIRCDFTFPDNLWNVEIDPGQISQVIQNVIVNSREAMQNCGVITIICRNVIHTQNTAEMLEGKNFLEIAISDTGPGIPKELQEKIFDPYFTTKKEGSGLGLAITHSIIIKHQGIISVHSVEPHGTTFIILLPATFAYYNAKKQLLTDPAIEHSEKIVLIMDDEENVRAVTSKMIDFLGYTALISAGGEEAIEIYRQYLDLKKTIDLVIMDLTIPGGMGGKEAAERILDMDPQAKLVVASGYSQDPIMSQFRSFGFCGVLSKPYHLKELQEMLHEIFNDSNV